MTKNSTKKAKKHLSKLRNLVTKKKSPLADLTEEEVIKVIRKTREEIWNKKLATRS